MSKYLTQQEAEEIINVMLVEHGFLPIEVYSTKETNRKGKGWGAWNTKVKQRKFLWWKWKSKKHTSLFVWSTELTGLVFQAEEYLQDVVRRRAKEDERRSEEARLTEAIRLQHATRLMNKTLEKE